MSSGLRPPSAPDDSECNGSLAAEKSVIPDAMFRFCSSGSCGAGAGATPAPKVLPESGALPISVEIGCSFEIAAWCAAVRARITSDPGSCIDSSKAASVGSGLNSGSFSSSNTDSEKPGDEREKTWPAASRAVVLPASAVATADSADANVGAPTKLWADFGESDFRSKPRATRIVPFDCSTLIGLVRTRLAPIRNAFATPAWPSTTAIESEVRLALEWRELLNSKVAFCSFSQSTTIASKCSAVSFFTAAKGSFEASISKSSSPMIWATVR